MEIFIFNSSQKTGFDFSCKLLETIGMKMSSPVFWKNKKIGDNLPEMSNPVFLEK